MYRGASRYVLSAGHCFHNGTSVTVGGQVSLNTENNKYQDIIPNPMIADVELLDIPSNLAGPYCSIRQSITRTMSSAPRLRYDQTATPSA